MKTAVDPVLDELATLALDNAFDVMMVTTSELEPPGPQILYVNPAFTRITGYSAAEAIGQTPRLLQGPKTDRAVLGRLRRSLASGRSANGEVLNYRKNGEEFWVQWRIRPVQDADGQVRHFVSTQRDITERKNVERMKSEVLASVSHEMRSPLTAIYGALDLFQLKKQGQAPDNDTRLLENAVSSCERLIRLVDTMLDTAKLTAAQTNLELAPCDLTELIEQTMTLLRLYAEELEVTVVFDKAVRDARILSDRDGLIQVLTNLLSNAIKFSPRAGTVRVGLERVASRLRLSVADHGPGIPEDFRPYLFQRFARADRSASARHRGIGLGLAISHDIVERLGGRLHYQTEFGVGTTFFVELPETG